MVSGKIKTRADVLREFGEPDRILKPNEGMKSVRWRCMSCGKVYQFGAPMRVPAPCECGGIMFEKQDAHHLTPDDLVS